MMTSNSDDDHFLFVKSYKERTQESILSSVNKSLERRTLLSRKEMGIIRAYPGDGYIGDISNVMELVNDEVKVHTENPLWTYGSSFPDNYYIRFWLHSGNPFSTPQVIFPGYQSDYSVDHGLLINHFSYLVDNFDVKDFLKVFCEEDVKMVGIFLDVRIYRKSGVVAFGLPMISIIGQSNDIVPQCFHSVMEDIYRTVLIHSVHEE